jgi:hypothetical protein
MIIDLELQKIDHLGKRTWGCIKHFIFNYIKDWVTCPLMLIFIASIVFVVIGYILPDNNENTRIL